MKLKTLSILSLQLFVFFCLWPQSAFPWGFATHVKINLEASKQSGKVPSQFVDDVITAGVMADGISVYHVQTNDPRGVLYKRSRKKNLRCGEEYGSRHWICCN